MELEDCAFPLLTDMKATDKASEAFAGADWVILVGGLPRKDGMSRADLIRANGPIFTGQGKAINDAAGPNVRVLTVANPCNTNCLIARSHAPRVPADRWFAMTRLDQNRAASQLATKAGVPVSAVKRVTIWGNHSDTQYPDYKNAEIAGVPATSVIADPAWFAETFIPTVAKRGGGGDQGRGRFFGGVGGQRGARQRPLAARPHAVRRMVQRGGGLRRQLRHPRRPDLQLPAGLPGRRQLVDRARACPSTTTRGSGSTPRPPS